MLLRKYILAAFVLLSSLMLSCNKEKQDCGRCNQLEGTWRFEKVTFRKDWSVHKTDLTEVYKDIRLHFYNDRTFLYHHSGRKVDLTGYWEMDDEQQSDGETSTTVTYLDWSAEDGNGNYEEGKWDNIHISRNGMNATESKYGGVYRFHLVRD